MELFTHQKEAVEKIVSRRGCAPVFAEMGTGKTRIAIAAASQFQCKRILVVCPLSVTSVWKREVEKCDIDWPIIDLTAGTLPYRAAEIHQTRDGMMLINYETYWRKGIREQLIKWNPDSVILDEAHRVRHRTARQSKFAHRWGDRPNVRLKLALTGTPITQGIENAWSIYRFNDPSVFGRWPDFERRYIVYGGYNNYQIKGYINIEEARDLIAGTAYQCKKDEASLPPRTDVTIKVKLDPETRRVYERLARDAVVQLKDAQGDSRTVIARIVLTMLLRLQQITGGFATADDGNVVDIGDEKARVTLDLVDDAVAQGERVVIFARFIHDLNILERRLHKYRVARLDGSVSGQDREAILKRFADGKYNVMIVQVRVGSVGIDLSAASVGIFYSTGYSLDDFIQARDRIHRYGQTRPVTYYHLVADDTVDEMIMDALRAKANLARRVTDLSYALSLFRT